MRLNPAAAFVIGLAGFAAVARADTLKVPSDDFPTIQSAVDAAVAGDVVLVLPGVYAETVNVVERTGITLKGKGFPTIQPGAAVGIHIASSDEIVVTGLEVYQATTGVEVQSCTGVSITKMVVSGSTGTAFELVNNEGVLISKCEVLGTGAIGVNDNSSTDVVLEKCLFTEIGTLAVNLSSSNAPGTGSDRARVSKNTVTDSAVGMRCGGVDIVVEKNRITTGSQGIYFDSSTSPTNALISKNTITTTGDQGIFVYGSNFEISKNKVTGGGIYDYGSVHVIDRNWVTGGTYGIYSNGSATTVTRNTIRGSTTGIFLSGYFLPVEGNRIWDAGTYGIQVNSTGQGPIAGNKVAGSAAFGILANASSNTYTGNKVTDSNTVGFYVTGAGNTFSMNRASGSGGLDLADTNAEGVNTYTDNRFGTTEFSFIAD